MDSTFTDLPLIGEPDAQNRLSGFVNMLRTEAMPERQNFTGFIPSANSLYLYGTLNPGQAHVYNKCMAMINSFVQQAAKYPPVVSIKPVTVMDGGPPAVDISGVPVILNAATIAAYFQTIFDAVWYRRSGADVWFQNVARDTKINGWQDTLVEWQSDKKSIEFHRIPCIQWYKDPTQPDIEKAAYLGLDWPVDAEWAKRTYPQLSRQIDEKSSRGVTQAPSSGGYSQLYMNQTYARPQVTMSFWWIRNREMLMTDQEAIASGLIVSRTVPVESINADAGASGPLGAEPGNPAEDQGFVEGSEPVDALGESASYEESGEPEYREALFDPATGEEMNMSHPGWPRKLVLSQTIQLVGQIVEDIECPAWDIPVVTGFNVQIPYRPYGQSACMTVVSQQNDLNTVHGNIVEHTNYYAAPYGVGDKRMQEDVPEEMKDRSVRPGKTYWVDLDNGQKASDMFYSVDPPPLPPSLPLVRNQLIESFNDSASRPDVQQGVAPTSNASGELAQTLLSAAQANTEYTFLSLNQMVWRAAMLAISYIIRDFKPEDYYRINRNFDINTLTNFIIPLIQEIEWGVDVEGAWDKEQRKQWFLALYGQGVIDLETLHDKIGIDHKTIMQRMANAAPSAVEGAVSGSEQEQLKAKRNGTQPNGLKTQSVEA